MKERLSVFIFLSSMILFGHRVLDQYWTYYGKVDGLCMYGAGLSIQHGTHEYIHEYGSTWYSEKWHESPLFQNDPEVFRSLTRFPGYVVPFNHPPVFAPILAALAFVGNTYDKWVALWWVLSFSAYISCIWMQIPDRPLRWLFLAVAIHFQPFLIHLELGATVLITMWLALHGGSLGIALAGWFKIYPWTLACNKKKFLSVVMWSIGLFCLWLVCGNIKELSDFRVLYQWPFHLHNVSTMAGQNSIATYVRMGIMCVATIWAIRKKWPPLWIFAIAQGISPFWWKYYWVVYVVVAADIVSRIYESELMVDIRQKKYQKS